jgi:hypothetical protein
MNPFDDIAGTTTTTTTTITTQATGSINNDTSRGNPREGLNKDKKSKSFTLNNNNNNNNNNNRASSNNNIMLMDELLQEEDYYMTTSTTIPDTMALVHTTPVENSWHFLGALPYRRITVYQGIDWSGQPSRRTGRKPKNEYHWNHTAATATTTKEEDEEERIDNLRQRWNSTILTGKKNLLWNTTTTNGSLAAYPPSYISAVELLDVDTQAYLETATTTLVTACPHGGPIAVVTLPKLPSTVSSQHFHSTWIRILTNSGNLITLIPFPPATTTTTTTTSVVTAADIMSIGFTARMVFLIITRDSTCYTYNVQGEALLQPFPILYPPSTTTSVELIHVSFFDSGVAVLSDTMASALVELLDEYDDPTYYLEKLNPTSSSSSSRIITSASYSSSNKKQSNQSTILPSQDATTTTTTTSYLALITPLPTASLCHKHLYSFCALAVLSKHLTLGRRPEVFLATSDHSVVVIDTSNNTNNILDVECRSKILSPIVQMVFSPNGRFLACFTLNQTLTVISTTFETKVLDFDTSEGSLGEPPEQIVWCGNDSVVLYWRNLGVLLVGPYGDWLRFSYDYPTSGGVTPTAATATTYNDFDENNNMDMYNNPNENNNNNNNNNDYTFLCLVGEMDCCRVISDQGVVELIQRVPPDTASLLRIGSIEPSAMLVDAWDAFVKGLPTADEAARAIMKTPGLIEEAIETCIDAASREFDIYTQKRLLHAASYGMSFTFKELDTCILGGNTVFTASTATTRATIQGEEVEEDQQDLEEYKEGEGKAAELVLRDYTSAGNNNNEERPTVYAKKIVSCSKTLRVLNMLRNPEVGLTLTISQYEEITPAGVIARLVAIRRPALAASISKYLDLDRKVQAFAQAAQAAAFVVAACSASSPYDGNSSASTATSSGNDAQIVEACVQMLENSTKDNSFASLPSVGVYAHVALAAFRAAGRPTVASLLLKRETSPIEKVLALLAIGFFADAANVAASTREDELLLKSLLEFEQFCNIYDLTTPNPGGGEQQQQQIPPARVKFNTMVIQKFPREASETLKLIYVNRGDIKSLTHLLFLSQNFLDAGSYNAKLAVGRDTSPDEKVAFLQV